MKTKKIVALVTATTMVLGCGFTALADSGNTTSVGSSTGHLEKNCISMTLPTVKAGTLNYIADPERIIQAYAAQDMDGDGNTDTVSITQTGEPVTPNKNGVYFAHEVTSGSGTVIQYENYSDKLTAINNGNQSIDLTVTLSAPNYNVDSDMEFVDNVPAAKTVISNTAGAENDAWSLDASDGWKDGTAPKLFMQVVHQVKNPAGEVTSHGATAINADATVSQTISVEGTDANFYIDTNGTNFYLRKKTDVHTQDTTKWNTVDFFLNGCVSNDDVLGSRINAPEFLVTWSWVNPNNSIQAGKTYTADVSAGTAITIPVALPDGATTITSAVFDNGGGSQVDVVAMSEFYSYLPGQGITLTPDFVDIALSSGSSCSLTLTFDDASASNAVVKFK